MAGWRSELAGCSSTLSMSKIKVKISETKYCSFYKTLAPPIIKGDGGWSTVKIEELIFYPIQSTFTFYVTEILVTHSDNKKQIKTFSVLIKSLNQVYI